MKSLIGGDKMFRYSFLKSAILTLIAILLSWFAPVNARCASSQQSPTVPDIERKCITDLSSRLNFPSDEIRCDQATKVTWPNSALGLGQAGRMYAMVLTPGWRFILDAKGVKYLYTASDKYFRYGGPLYLWSHSALYVKPVENDPNLNGDLIQISLMGTHPRLIMHGVTDFFPQDNGGIIATRRTSRSGFDLLYLAPGRIDKPVVIAGGFAFGDAAINDNGTEWIAFHKDMLAFNWNLMRGKVGSKPDKDQIIQLPEGARPVGAVWTKNGFFLGISLHGKTKVYRLTDQNKLEDTYDNPVPPDGGYELNRSDNIKIENMDINGNTKTVISRIRFDGITRFKMILPNFKYLHSRPIPNDNLLISGLQNGHYAAYIVNYYSGLQHCVIDGLDSNVKYWDSPPHDVKF